MNQATNPLQPELDPFQRLNLQRRYCPQDRCFADFDVLEQLALAAGFVHRMDGAGKTQSTTGARTYFVSRSFHHDKWLCTRQALLQAATEIVRLRAIIAAAGLPIHVPKLSLKTAQGGTKVSVTGRAVSFDGGPFEVVREERQPAVASVSQPAATKEIKKRATPTAHRTAKMDHSVTA